MRPIGPVGAREALGGLVPWPTAILRSMRPVPGEAGMACSGRRTSAYMLAVAGPLDLGRVAPRCIYALVVSWQQTSGDTKTTL